MTSSCPPRAPPSPSPPAAAPTHSPPRPPYNNTPSAPRDSGAVCLISGFLSAAVRDGRGQSPTPPTTPPTPFLSIPPHPASPHPATPHHWWNERWTWSGLPLSPPQQNIIGGMKDGCGQDFPPPQPHSLPRSLFGWNDRQVWSEKRRRRNTHLTWVE